MLADLDFVAWSGRKVYIAIDSDVMTKKAVQQALDRLAEILRRKEASVRHIYLPEGPEGCKVGVDDFLAAGHSVQDLLTPAQEPGSKNDPSPLVLEQLPDAPVTSQARVPEPYRLKGNGVYVVTEKENKIPESCMRWRWKWK